MVVILDLGDDLTDEQRAAYGRQIAINSTDAVAYWTHHDPAPDGRMPLPTGVLVAYQHDRAPAGMGSRSTRILYIPPTGERQCDWAQLEKIVDRHTNTGDPQAELFIGRDVLAETDAAAYRRVTDYAPSLPGEIYAFVTHGHVNLRKPEPTTVESIEAFLNFDPVAVGHEIIEHDLQAFARAAAGAGQHQLWAVHVQTGCQRTRPNVAEQAPDWIRTHLVDDFVGDLMADVARLEAARTAASA